MQRLATVVTLGADLLARVAAPTLAERTRGINALWHRGGVTCPLPMQW
jgi:hypothetical protein